MAFPFLAAIGAVQAISGIVKGNNASDDAARLRASRKSFKTTDEVYDIVNASTSRATAGLDPATLEYLTNNIDRGASAAYGTAKRLGANPNDLSSIFDQQMQGYMQVGAQDAAVRMENFSKYLGAKELLSKNLEAEWASEQGMIKDDLQAAAQAKQEAAAQVSGGLSNVVSAISASEIMKLYKAKQGNKTMTGTTAAGASASDGMAGATGNSPNFSFADSNRFDAGTILQPEVAGSLASVVTPESNFRRGRTRIIGIQDGEIIYGR